MIAQLTLALLTITTTAVPAATVTATIAASPAQIAVTTFFDGTEVEVSGTAPNGPRLAVLLAGASGTVDLKKKGKVWGVLWMNVGEVSFEHVPEAYLLATAGPVCDLAPFEVRRDAGIGLDVLVFGAGAAGDGESLRLFGELVGLKEHERLFGSFEGALEIRPGAPGEVAYSATLPVPARIPQGSYRLELWGFDDGSAAVLAATGIQVATTGVTHDVASLAHHHGLLYGVLSLVLALGVGLVTGLVFGLAGKGGH